LVGYNKFEADENFQVVLSAPVNATVSQATATGTIFNDDAQPQISVTGASGPEGGISATNPLSFVISLSNPSSQTVTVLYSTIDGTATTAGNDYQGTSGTLTFAPGVISQTISVPLVGDNKFEADETFGLTLSAPQQATLSSTSVATGTIVNDDPLPQISIAGVSGPETNGGATTFVFQVTLSNPSSQTVIVQYATADGSATSGDGDYQSTSGALTFAPGITSQTIAVPVNGDPVFEADEDFQVALSRPSGATLTQATATGTILNDDPLPQISIADASGAEGNTGSAPLTFVVSLSNPSSQTITVAYSTADGAATAASGDYQATAGVLTFAPGVVTQTIAVAINGDAKIEPNESFQVALSNPLNAALSVAPFATGTILNDDTLLPLVSISSASGVLDTAGTLTPVTFTVTLSEPSSEPVVVHFATADGTAIAAAGQYLSVSGDLTFAPGVTQQTITVQVVGNTIVGSTLTFAVNLSAPVGAQLAVASGLATLTNDELLPQPLPAALPAAATTLPVLPAVLIPVVALPAPPQFQGVVTTHVPTFDISGSGGDVKNPGSPLAPISILQLAQFQPVTIDAVLAGFSEPRYRGVLEERVGALLADLADTEEPRLVGIDLGDDVVKKPAGRAAQPLEQVAENTPPPTVAPVEEAAILAQPELYWRPLLVILLVTLGPLVWFYRRRIVKRLEKISRLLGWPRRFNKLTLPRAK
jgi:hypothetical protein